MKIHSLIIPVGMAFFATQACGDSNETSHSTPHKAGAAGKGGSGGQGAGGKSGSAGGKSGSAAGGSEPKSGQGGEAGDSTGGVGAASGRSSAGGRAGNGSAGRARGGTAGKQQTSGGTGATAAGASGEAGQAGAGNARLCAEATAEDWVDISDPDFLDYVRSYGAFLTSDELPPNSTIDLNVLLPDTGTFTFGLGDDENFKTCQRCLLADTKATGEPQRTYFAESGTLKIAASSDAMNGLIDAELTDVRLVEVTIDDMAVSTPVEDGACIHLASAEVHVDPNAPPGAGGAGGQGGSGGESGAAGAPNVPTDCIEIGIGAPWVYNSTDTIYTSIMTPPLGSPAADGIGLMFWYSNEVGTFELGQGVDATWATCERCFIAVIPVSSTAERPFFAVAGTLEIEGTSNPMGGDLDATVTDVTLVELTDDRTEPLEGGTCLHLPSATISVH